MIPAVLALLAGVAARAVYPRLLERRHGERLPVGDDGIIRGAESIDFRRPDAPGALLLHGGGDTPQVLAALAQHLHRRGFSVRVPLLSGHGRELSALSQTSASQWHDDVRREFAEMRATHDWVGVVGLSMGGALAIQLATEREDIPALVLLSPYIVMPTAVRQVAATSQLWGWLFPYFSSRGAASIRDPEAAARGRGHGVLTPAVLRGLYDVVNDAWTALPHVRPPTLVVQSREDNRIPVQSAERGFAQLGATEKKLVWIEGAAHVITVDFGHQRVFELTADWLEQHQPATHD